MQMQSRCANESDPRLNPSLHLWSSVRNMSENVESWALLKAAASRGLVAVDGLGMLLHQARPGFEAWFGTRPTVDEELRAHVLAGRDGG